ncbi:hypothetical protein P872_12145 [Rhodonellum psychrophilum GCM71 = DSM 17998]|uniref:Lipoprotein n=2 Tax=Rhodonellum TaxID=336827 RepID=U5BSS8_9BACT|nr:MULTISPECIES: hypothetical protein [Rhodonellum]ERM80938.1 hypothetical protein P872_12145 [Rhodonellum psychrophilum GCM71 = DSM 17998]SDZ31186.1 hypothetical protein SAMN05444412_1102 [Rhodonellum ikkaensis]
MRQFYSSIVLLILLVLSGCFTKEEKPSENGILKLESLELLKYDSGNPNNGRTQESSPWNHVFKSDAVLKIKNTATGAEYSLNYDANAFSGSEQVTIPYGDYTYTTEVTGSAYENYLPYKASGNFRMNVPVLLIKLDAETEYGLVTVENTNVKPSPILIDGQQISMNLVGNYYYKYVLKDKAPVLEIIENVFGNTIRRSLSIAAYKHYNYVVRISDGSGKVIELVLKDFELIEEEILVNVGTVPTSYSPTLVSVLNVELSENSGLALFAGKLWTINDSGNENIIYEMDPVNGNMGRKVRVTNAVNVDWESMAQSETHLFVGDFGNNSGNRKDLTILKIEKSSLLASDAVTAEKINFSYPDQTSFVSALNSNNFDCEAFYFQNDSLHLFTKNWVDNKTKYYTLSSQPGERVANYKMDFDTQGLVTAADINQNTGEIVLLGYQNLGLSSQSFVWLLSGYAGSQIFSGKKSKINLGSPAVLGQTEGIFLNKDNTGYISSERIQLGGFTVPAKLLAFDFKAFF